MKLLSTLLLLIALPAYVFAQGQNSTPVTVTENIEGRPDDQVRHAAKVKAAFAGIDRLPVVIKGKETLSNDEFNAFVNALGIGYVDVKTTREDWDREKGVLTLFADVSLDAVKTEDALGRITALEHTKKQLQRAYKVMDGILNKSLVSETDLASIDLMQKGVMTGIAVRTSVAESVLAKNALIDSMSKRLRIARQALLSQYKIEILDATGDGIKAKASGPADVDPLELFSDTGLTGFYDSNMAEINKGAGVICLHVFRYRWSFDDKPATPENYYNRDSIDVSYHVYREKAWETGTQYAVMQVRPSEVNKEVLISDGSDFSMEYYDMVLERPDQFLKMGICAKR